MRPSAPILTDEKAAFAGEICSLLQQLGAPKSKCSADAFTDGAQVCNPDSLRKFLHKYQTQILIPLELPAIFQAYRHACRNECRELVALDQKLRAESRWQKFAAVSRQMGQVRLEQMRPLRDHRLVQRYLQAIAHGEANGWHTLVYGVELAVFTVPLRQGLQAYAEQTVNGFSTAIVRARHWDERLGSQIAGELSQGSQSAVEKLFSAIPFGA